VRRVVPDQLERLRALRGHDLDRLAVLEWRRQVAQVAIRLDRERRAGEPLADRGRGVCAGGPVVQLELVAVGKLDLHRV
jgi:hypothetical protein